MKKRIMKSITCVILVLCLVLPLQVNAADAAVSIDIVPYFTHITNVTSNLEIESGQANMYSSISAYGVDQVRMSNYLQKYQSGAWSTVNSWTKLVNGTYGSWSQSYGVTSGTYRLRTYFYVYINGVVVESTSVTTANVYY